MASQPNALGGLRGLVNPLSPEFKSLTPQMLTTFSKGQVCGSPLSTASTSMSFSRQLSGQTELSMSPMMWSLPDPHFRFSRQGSMDEMFLDEEEATKDEESDEEIDQDGVHWVKTVGTGVSLATSEQALALGNAIGGAIPSAAEVRVGGKFQTLSQSHHKMLMRKYSQQVPAMSDLEAQLSEVKALFEQNHGEDLDEQAKMGGKFQTFSRSHHRMLAREYSHQPPTTSDLDMHVADLTLLFKQKFGHDLDGDSELVETSSSTIGGKFHNVSLSHHRMLMREYCHSPPTFTDLEVHLSDVKALFKQKYGKDWDEEEATSSEKVGGRFQTVSRSHHRMLDREYSNQAPKTSDLEAHMADVKMLFKLKFGEDFDEEEATGAGSAGGKFQTLSRSHHRMLAREYSNQAPSVSDLDAHMADVKMLFKQKYGEDLDEEEAAIAGSAGGKFQTLSRSHHRMLAREYSHQMPSMTDLDAQLAEVKDLFKRKFNEDFDEE